MKPPKFSEETKLLFLDALESGASVRMAASKAGLSTSWLFTKREQLSDFEVEWIAAAKIGLKNRQDMLEEECIRRASVGTKEPVYYRGRVVGHIAKKSDGLLMFMLKSLDPVRYRDNLKVDAKVDLNINLQNMRETIAGRPESKLVSHIK